MRLKLYRAASMADAMAQLRCELGPEALILSTRRVAGGVELTAALDQPDEPPLPPRPLALDAAYHGIPAELARSMSGTDLAASLRQMFRFGPLPQPSATQDRRALLLAGPPGAGKTLTTARLATRLVLGGARPLVITADGRRAGGAEELAAYTRLLGLTLLAAATPTALKRAVAQAADGAPILIDTAGANPFDAEDMDALAALIDTVSAEAVLVLPAGGHPEEAAEHAGAFARLGIAHFLPTRLDLTRRLGSVVAVAGTGLILTEAGVGTGATDGLVPMTAEFLAERLSAAPAPPCWPEAAAEAAPAPVAAPANGLRAPIFPTARSRAAQSWEPQLHG